MRASDLFLSHPADSHRAPSVAGAFPTPREVLGEIGLALAIHLAVVLGAVLALQTFGIA
jgi:hypothetical protein